MNNIFIGIILIVSIISPYIILLLFVPRDKCTSGGDCELIDVDTHLVKGYDIGFGIKNSLVYTTKKCINCGKMVEVD